MSISGYLSHSVPKDITVCELLSVGSEGGVKASLCFRRDLSKIVLLLRVDVGVSVRIRVIWY